MTFAPETSRSVIMDHEARLRALESAAQLGTSSIREGTLQFLDETGTARVILGRIGDTYGLQVLDQGSTVADNEVLAATFAPQTAVLPDEESTFSDVYFDLTTPGPTVTQPVSSTGNLLVIVGAAVEIRGFQSAAVSYKMEGANMLIPSDLRSAELASGNSEDAVQRATVTYTHLFTDLEPGPTTIVAMYRSDGLKEAFFKNRFLFTLPL